MTYKAAAPPELLDVICCNCKIEALDVALAASTTYPALLIVENVMDPVVPTHKR